LLEFRQQGLTFSFRPSYRIHPDNTNDRPDQGPDFAYNMVLFYTVIAAELGDAQFTITPTAHASVSYAGPGIGPVPLQHNVVGLGDSSFSRAVVGIRSFRWHLGETISEDGRYVRALHTFLTGDSYSPAAGTMDFLSSLWFSNDSAVTLGFNAEHLLSPTLIQYADDSPLAHVVLHNAVRPGVDAQVTRTVLL
jgi:hypothetical protein